MLYPYPARTVRLTSDPGEMYSLTELCPPSASVILSVTVRTSSDWEFPLTPTVIWPKLYSVPFFPSRQM